MAEPHPPDGPLSRLGLAIIALVVLVDQATKHWAEAALPAGESFDLLPILSLYRVYNPGIAFSFLADYGALPLILVTLAITVVVLLLWRHAQEGGRWASVGYALIVGGAIGNLIDRILHGYVIDFLLLHYGPRTLFVFNVADAALTLGPAILILVYLWPKRVAAGR